MSKYIKNTSIDVEDAIETFVSGRNIKESLPQIVKIASEQHKYLKQWKESRWSFSVIRSLVDIIKKYEVNDLHLQGRSVWVLLMCLEHGGKQSTELQSMKDDEEFVCFLIEAMFKIIFEFTIYMQSIEILRLLVQFYGFNAAKVFEIGKFILVGG
jgi:hypothetical protein